MKKYICRACGYVFSAENPEPDFDKIVEMDEKPDGFECPKCGAYKANLVPYED